MSKKSKVKRVPKEKTDPLLNFDITHDQFFKETFGQIRFAIAFLKVILDAVLLRQLDLDGLTVEDTAYLDKRFKSFYSDVVYRIPLRNGKAVFIHIIIEHKSHNDHGAIFQLANYVILIHTTEAESIEHWTADTQLSPIIPVILHQGKSAFTGPTQLNNVIRKIKGANQHQMWMKAILYDLSQLTIENIPHDPDCPELWPVLMIMKVVVSKQDVLAQFENILLELKPYSDDPYYLRLIRLCVHYVASRCAKDLQDSEIQQLDKTIQDTIGGDNMPTFANSYYATGLVEGEERGIVIGEERGIVIGEERGIVIGEVRGILKARFGPVPARVVDRLSNFADLVVLESLAVIATDCKTLEEFEDTLGDYTTTTEG